MRNKPLKAFASPLKHNIKEEHAHSTESSRSSRPFITVSGKRGSTLNIEGTTNMHSSTKGSYDELLKKSIEAKIKKLKGK